MARNKNTPAGFQNASSLFAQYTPKENKGYITQEFQDFGYRLAVELADLEHKSLYMRMAKTIERGILEQALSFVSDSEARSKARLFMWKVKELRRNAQEKPIKKKEQSLESQPSLL